MWRKSDDSKPNSSSADSPSSVSSAQRPAAASPDSSRTPAAVTQGIKIKGELSGREDFFFDGAFEGKILLADFIFTVGPNARVNAEIEAREIIVRGEVVGTLKARERVQVWSTGKVTGDMDTRGIVVEDGAVLHGKVAPPPNALPQPAAPPAAAREAAAG